VPLRDTAKFMPADAHSRRREMVAALFQARGEPEKFVHFFHEDAVLHMVGRRSDYSFSGDYRGRAQILALLRRVDGDVERGGDKIHSLVIDGDKVGLRRSVVVRHRGTATVATLSIGNFAIFRDDRIAEAWEYHDTAWIKRLSGDVD
jgi:ketosteroid isomerase-like protein